MFKLFYLAFGLFILNHAIYSLTALGFVFNRNAKISWHLNLLKVTFQGTALVLMAWAWSHKADITTYFGVLSITLGLLSIFCFIWAHTENKKKPLTIAFSQDSPTHLVTTGPYRWVRHPFYLAYLLNFLSLALLYPHALSLLVFIAIYLIYHFAAKKEETKFRESALSKEYHSYSQQTGRFLPKLW